MLGLGYFPQAAGKAGQGPDMFEGIERDYIQSLKESGRIYSQIFGVNVERFESQSIHPSSLVIGGWDGSLTPDRSKLSWFDIAIDGLWTIRVTEVRFANLEKNFELVGSPVLRSDPRHHLLLHRAANVRGDGHQIGDRESDQKVRAAHEAKPRPSWAWISSWSSSSTS